ncbi:hypothetical protein G6736_08090 [Polynucleobacter paneuropaeus]|nr:hypothetical protein [Polynucleobacter paneuropaeus]MBT8539473.1 hypothetical protein [Polynucleobacter paneuropaeus]RAZ47519.1 hypothetical protein DP175_04590 [Polynucleobacter paneuropaeus]
MNSTKVKNLILELPHRAPLEIIFERISKEIELNTGMDGLMIETNWGFNDLGIHGQYIAQAMGIDEDVFRFYAESLMKEQLPTIDIIPTQSLTPTLKAIALVSTPNCESYKPFSGSTERPSKDFFYNVTYEALTALIGIVLKILVLRGLQARYCLQKIRNTKMQWQKLPPILPMISLFLKKFKSYLMVQTFLLVLTILMPIKKRRGCIIKL